MAKGKGIVKTIVAGLVLAVVGVGVYHAVKHWDKVESAFETVKDFFTGGKEETPNPDQGETPDTGTTPDEGGEQKPEAPLTCEVTIKIGNETTTQTVATGGLVTFPEEPTKEGFNFLGYAVEGSTQLIDPETFTVTENVTLVAVFEEMVESTDASLFTIEDGKITGYHGEATEIVMPRTYSLDKYGKVVKGIDYDITSFSAFLQNNTTITKVVIQSNIKSIPSNAFNGCTALENISLPETLTSVSTNAFTNCTSLKYNEVETAKYLGNENNPYIALVQETSSDITNSVIKEGCRVICPSVFKGKTLLQSVQIPEGVVSIGNEAFYNTRLTKVEFPSTLKTILTSAFYNNTALTEVTFNEGLTNLPSNSFAKCTSLTTVKLPNTLTTISNSAFNGCNALVYNEVDGAKYLPSEDNETFALMTLSDKATFTISETCEVIGQNACANVTCESITIPASVRSIGTQAFTGAKYLKTIVVAEENEVYDSRNNCNAIIKTETNELITGCQGTTIPEDVEKLGNYAFGNMGLTSVTIPASVRTMGSNVFSNCTTLTEVNYLGSIKEWLTIENMSPYSNPVNFAKTLAIKGETLTEITAENLEGLTEIKDSALINCLTLTKLELPETVTSIGSSAFQSTGITEVVIPGSVTTIESSAFRYCESLKRVEVSANVTEIGSSAFASCTNLDEVVLHDGLTIIGSYMFESCTALTEVNIPASVKTIEMRAFYDCTSNLIFAGTTPATIETSTFSTELKIYVPEEALTTYKTTWTNFASQIKSVSELEA